MGDRKKMKTTEKVSHYHSLEYNSKERFNSYWHQINEVLQLNPINVLEIGVGNGFVSKYLKDAGVKIDTLDIDVRLNPDIAGTVLDIPIINESFDLVICYEILEHLPFSEFNKALSEIYRVSQQYVILSLPDISPAYRWYLELPKIRSIKCLIAHPLRRSVNHKSCTDHFWEIGYKNYSLESIQSVLIQSGFRIMNTYRIFDCYRQRIFLLQKES
jgi:ubiquinone/menaquinone biosynthesis C-methylase UbiE